MKKIKWVLLLFGLVTLVSMIRPTRWLFILNKSNENLLITVNYYDKEFINHLLVKVPLEREVEFNLLETYDSMHIVLNTPNYLLEWFRSEIRILDIYDETGNIIFTLDDIDETFFDADTHDIIITQEMLDRQRARQRVQEGNELSP